MSDRSSPQFFVRIFREGVTQAQRVGVDVRAKIISLSYEDNEKAADKLKLEVDNFDIAHFDSPTFVTGAILEVSWGYAGNMSPHRECVISKVTGSEKLTVEALGRESLLNKLSKTRVFQNVKRSDVARLIAQEQGFDAALQDIEDTEIVLSQVSQSRMTDHQLLRDLAQREGFVVYIDSNGFHFHRRRVGQTPIRSFTYYIDKTGDLLKFPTFDVDITAKPGAVTAKGRDPLKKRDINERADNDAAKGRPVLASELEVIDRVTGQSTLQTRNASEATMATTATSSEDAKRQAAGAYLNGQLKAIVMKCSAIGDPQFSAKTVATFNNIGKLTSGNYYCTKVTHKLAANGGYTMDLETRRDGTNGAKGAGGPAKTLGKTNDGKGPSAASDELEPVEIVDEVSGQTRVEYRLRTGRS